MSGGVFDQTGNANPIGDSFLFGQYSNSTVNLNGGTFETAVQLQPEVPGNNLNFNGGTLQLAASLANLVSIPADVAMTVNSGGAVFDLQGNNTTISNALLAGPGSGGLTLISTGGGGTLTLSGANTYTGATAISAGSLQAGIANAIPSGSAVTLANGATLKLNNHNETIASLADSGTAGGNVTLGSGTLTTGNSASTIYTDMISGTGGLTEQGSGTFTLGGGNTYTGPTTVSAGTLLVNGSLASASAVSVASGATLGGSGTAAGRIVDSGVVSPGQSFGLTGTGILNAGPTTFNSGSSFDVELNGTTAGSGYDQLSVTGSATLGSGVAALNLAIGPNFSASTGATFNILVTSSGVTGTFSGLAQRATFAADGQVFTISYQGSSGNNVVLTYDGAFTTTTVALLTGANPSTYGTALTFTATVTSSSLPTGSAEFYDGATALGAGSTLSGSGDSATLTFTISTLSAAAHAINAVYTPTGVFAGSSSTNLSQTVNPAALMVTATSESETYGFGGTSAALGTTGFSVASML